MHEQYFERIKVETMLTFKLPLFIKSCWSAASDLQQQQPGQGGGMLCPVLSLCLHLCLRDVQSRAESWKGNWWSEDIMSIMYCKESQQKLKISEPAWWHGESLSWYSEIYFMSTNLRHETKSTYIKTYIFIRTQSLLSIMSRTFPSS